MDVHILVRNPALRSALEALAEATGRRATAIEPQCALDHCGHFVVASAAGFSTRECLNLARRGARVVLLAALPSDRERKRYLEAGAAAYLPMGTSEGELREVIFGPGSRAESVAS
jgi:hypothetical protein